MCVVVVYVLTWLLLFCYCSNPMAGLAMNSAQDFLQKQSEMYLPGAYGVWGSLKYYFTVNNSYVISRLKVRSSMSRAKCAQEALND
jgi:hypothetical protein